ncbi:glycoside hydrolase TIM-barrel-like domain-containing protein [Candidatus Tisiphia endosymbiont of Oplodontha viridula]|uniref:baseplate multidomain protein megatron n=1 Tax=Candidatus Tisiphia endosymbiont of Oplodontha viridula TaxID=3077925 RepID=UPI0035C91987
MTNAILPVAGAVGGFFIGGSVGAIMGANLGMAANNLFLPRKKQSIKLPTQEGSRLSDLRVQLSSYGEVIPKIYGSMRLAGNIIWATDIKEVATEHEHSECQNSGGKGGGGRQTVITTQSTITYSYFVSLAISICEGEVNEIIRIWADSKLLTEDILRSDQGKFNIHLGTEEQMPDDIIGKYKSAQTYPAYRGLCYVAIEDFPLEQFGNRIPNFTFEVKRLVKFKPAVEDKIKEVVLIPGAGEFVYADQLYTKQDGMNIGNSWTPLKNKHYLNMHNYANKPNMFVALEQMARTLPNLEWVALVVTWFATSSRAVDCRIVPKVEYYGDSTKMLPNDWQVAGVARSQAEVVLYINEFTPTYGGTPSDDSVVAICQHLKKCGYKVTFYPMIFVDELEPKAKPWRGRITATSVSEIDNWFNNPVSGYNSFIMHYADLMVGQVDAFIIGSEMVSLTSFTDRTGSYPAVEQFIQLASMVKAKLGNTLVTYAADWTEYHHTNGGWFNLDPLWASPNIDFVGIDAYFPLTEDLPHSQITEELIKKGWESGEGWDYYWDWQRKQKYYFAAESPQTPDKYAWKNLQHWWTTVHHNPNGRATNWQPKMKPIWFTEFGFPSVDACSNQPNVFYDPTSVESYFPRNSKGRVNFLAQRHALNATLDYLAERNSKEGCEQLIPKRFVWTYDARPFPFWPDFKNIWQDGILWSTGHWINGKLGGSSLGAIVAEILASVGLKPTDYDVSRLTQDVYGYIINQHITAREAIEQLQSAYFFDVVESDGILKFMLRLESMSNIDIEEDNLVTVGTDSKTTIEISITQELELPQKVSVTHIDCQQNYDLVTVQLQRQAVQITEQVNFSLPIVLDEQSAKQIADITLYNAWQERISYQLTLLPQYGFLEPTDIINVICTADDNQVQHQLRIVKTDMQRSGLMKIFATSFNMAMYDFHSDTNYLTSNYELPKPVAATIMELIETPTLPTDAKSTQPILRIAIVPDGSNWQGTAIYNSRDDGYDYKLLATTTVPSVMGVVTNQLSFGYTVIFDCHNEIIVQLLYGSLSSVSELALLNGSNAALIGDELVQFQNAELIGDHKYKLTKLLRGRQGTEWAINKHQVADKFVLLNSAVMAVNLNHHLIGRKLLYKPVSVGNSFGETNTIESRFMARNLKPLAPVHTKSEKDKQGNIIISWIRRSRIDSDWRDYVDVPLGEEFEKYQVDIKSGNNVIRTLEASSPNVIYSKQAQTADFAYASEIPVNLNASIYQLSSQIGRGYGTTLTLL